MKLKLPMEWLMKIEQAINIANASIANFMKRSIL